METKKFFISKVIPGLILNVNNIHYIKYDEKCKWLTLVFGAGSSAIEKVYTGEEADKLYDELYILLSQI